MKIKYPKKLSKREIKNFFLSHGMKNLITHPRSEGNLVNSFYNDGKIIRGFLLLRIIFLVKLL